MDLPIITYPDPILRKKNKKIKDPTDPKIKKLIFDMLDTLEANNGLGLAAPQVGENLRLCVIKMERKTFILINPKIVSKSLRKEVMEEGCLSFPGEFIPIKRSKKVKVHAETKEGDKIEIEAEGMLARALQHEIDHLDGTLFIDRK
ncbi:MAG: peptide deformylase [Candidatus Moranbacteria bacterium]|nr:peptide deformylase [Candidatus Moranbacteria bacterium]